MASGVSISQSHTGTQLQTEYSGHELLKSNIVANLLFILDDEDESIRKSSLNILMGLAKYGKLSSSI